LIHFVLTNIGYANKTIGITHMDMITGDCFPIPNKVNSVIIRIR